MFKSTLRLQTPMKSFQIAEKSGINIAICITDTHASEELSSLKKQGFNIHDQIIEASSTENAQQIFAANRPKSKRKIKRWIFLALVVAVFVGFSSYNTAFEKGKNLVFQSGICDGLELGLVKPEVVQSIMLAEIQKTMRGSSNGISYQGMIDGALGGIQDCAKDR